MTDAPLTYADAERLLGCSRSRVEKLVARGELPSFRIGAQRCFRREDIEAFIEQRIRDEGRARTSGEDPFLSLVQRAAGKAKVVGGRR